MVLSIKLADCKLQVKCCANVIVTVYKKSCKVFVAAKAYSLVSDDVCNYSATRVFIRTNGEDVKNIKNC